MAWADPLANGHWRGGYRDSNGRKQYVKDSHGETVRYPRKSDAKLAASEAEAEARRRGAIDKASVQGRITWGDWWDLIAPKRQFSSDTAINEAKIVRKYLRPKWGTKPLNKINQYLVQDWIDEDLNELSAVYVTRIYAVFRTSIMMALKKKGILSESPLVGIELPPQYKKASKKYMTTSDLEKLRGKLRDDYFRIIEFALETGLRPGELCGLHADHVDTSSGWLNIEQVYVSRLRVIRSSPKDKDARLVPLTSRAAEILDEVMSERDLTGGCGVPHADGKPCASDLVFRSVSNRAFTPGSMEAYLRQVALRHKLPVLSPYTARRGFATWSIEGDGQTGLDILTVQKIMGHSDLDELQGYFQLTAAARGRLQAARGEKVSLKIVSESGATHGATLEQQAQAQAGSSNGPSLVEPSNDDTRSSRQQ